MGCGACAHQPPWLWGLVAASLVTLWGELNWVAEASRMIVDVFLVVLRSVVTPLECHMGRKLEPGNSSNDQCHAHDKCKLSFSAVEQALGRSSRRPHSLHIHIHPRRNPHERLDRSKNFVALPHEVAPTKNFVFDSHWQQSRSIRWNYIWERRRPWANTHTRPQYLYVASDVVVMVPAWADSIRGLRMVMPPVKGWR